MKHTSAPRIPFILKPPKRLPQERDHPDPSALRFAWTAFENQWPFRRARGPWSAGFIPQKVANTCSPVMAPSRWQTRARLRSSSGVRV
ncbi:hypothetical protein [Prosthecobacter sp.]|uniref:hypothetical protein n=1 Tax=Prosthecobacter sp. TaxID=1965333 RepID=UPI003784B41F